MGVSHRTQASIHSGVTCSLTSGLSSFLGVLAVQGAQIYRVVDSVPSSRSHTECSISPSASKLSLSLPNEASGTLPTLMWPPGYGSWVGLANTHPVVSKKQARPEPLCSKRHKFTSKSPPLEGQFRMMFPSPCPSSTR